MFCRYGESWWKAESLMGELANKIPHIDSKITLCWKILGIQNLKDYKTYIKNSISEMIFHRWEMKIRIISLHCKTQNLLLLVLHINVKLISDVRTFKNVACKIAHCCNEKPVFLYRELQTVSLWMQILRSNHRFWNFCDNLRYKIPFWYYYRFIWENNVIIHWIKIHIQY